MSACYNPLMDAEALRRQIYEELQADFGSKLREAKRQKQLAEEQTENSAERWRTERRRLNAEIDRLEAALADAKDASRAKTGSAKPAGIDPLEVAKIRTAADERLQEATSRWEHERQRFKSEILRLENAVADAIERSSNPLRAAMPIKQELESRIEDLKREKAGIEADFARAKTEWSQEKLKLTGQVVKSRRPAGQSGPAADAPGKEKPRIQQLEKQLKKLRDAAQQSERERKELTDHAGQLQEAFLDAKSRLESLQASQEAIDHEAKMREAARVKADLENELTGARNEWDEERRRLRSEIEQLKQAVGELSATKERIRNEVVDQLRRQYDDKLQEMIQQKTKLAQELQDVNSLLESERVRFMDETASAKPSATVGPAPEGIDKEAIDAELARVETLIREIVALIDDPAAELSTVIRKNVEKTELDAYLKGILFCLGHGQGP